MALFLAFSANVSAQRKSRSSSPPPSRPSRSQPQSAPSHNSAPAQAPHSTPSSTPSNTSNRTPGSTTIYGNNRNTGGSTTVTPSNAGNNRPGSSTVYSPAGKSNPSLNNNARPAGNPTSATPGGYNRTPGTYNANSNRTAFPPKATIYHAPGGGQVQTRSDGSIREVRTSGGAIIHHAPDGYRRVEVQRPGGRVIVASTHGGYGYVQRPLVVSNRTYIQRTYVVNGVSYARVYRPWVYGGFTYNVYTPVHFWSPGFYAYAYNPWVRPVYYGWGWNIHPWYGYYGGWFTPYPYYTSPAFWLTDFLIARTLEDAYQARMEARAAAAANAQANYGATPLTPEVKQAVADEVRRQLDRERAEQQSMNALPSSGAPPLFSGGTHVFVVANSLDVDAGGGQMCPVTEGDVLQLNAAPPANSNYGQVVVLASKGNDCRKGSTVSVALSDLQEMQNQMRATIDQGLNDLQSKQGQGGLPTLPASAAGQPTQAAFAAQVKPDSTAASELSQAAQEADRAERDVVSQSAPATVTLGQSVQEVEAVFGKPRDIADLGSKKIYVYKDLKVTFVKGKVTDVQ